MRKNVKILGLIPARYASTRFHAKALADIKGKTMVQRVYEQASKSKVLDSVYVATDHEEIAEVVSGFGGQYVMTKPDHKSGTDRCYEALSKIGGDYDYIVNIQGDEPFIHPEQIDECAGMLDGKVELATLVAEVKSAEELLKKGEVMVVFDKDHHALYFSRHSIPFVQGVPKEEWLQHSKYYKHVSVYAYRTDILKAVTNLPVSALEASESLEQLRWLENGYKIKIGITNFESIGIDTPEDLEWAVKKIFKD